MIDDRAEYADPARFSDVTTVLTGDVNTALSHYVLSNTDAVVIATRGHRNDALILEQDKFTVPQTINVRIANP